MKFFPVYSCEKPKKHCQITFNCVVFADTIENRNDIKTMFEKIFVETHEKKLFFYVNDILKCVIANNVPQSI